MTSYIIAGSSDARETTECETLARNIKTLYSNINFIMILKHPNEWNACIKEICRNYGFKKPSNPIIFTSDGKLIGSTLEFNELAEAKFGFRSHMIKDRLDHQVNKKLADSDYTERHREKHLIEIIEEKYQEALKNNKISKLAGEFRELIDHGLVYYVKDTNSTAPVMRIPEQRLLEIPIEIIPDVQLDFKEKIVEESLLPDTSIRPGSQPQDASKKGSNVLSDDKPKTPAENETRRKGKTGETTTDLQPTNTEGTGAPVEEIKQENPENLENPESQRTENAEEGQPQEEQLQQQPLEIIEEEDPPEDIPAENPEYPNVLDYVISNIFGDYYLCLHPQPLFEGQCILVQKVEKPKPPKKIEELKEIKSNRIVNEVTNQSELDQTENVTSPTVPNRRTDAKLSAGIIDFSKPEGIPENVPTNSNQISNKPKTNITETRSEQLKSDRADDNKSENGAARLQDDFIKELDEEDLTEKLYTKDYSRNGRFRSRPKKALFRLDEEGGEQVEEDEYEERKEKKEIEQGQEQNESYLIRNHTDILTPLSKVDWQTIYKVVKDTDSLAFLQWLPKNSTNYLQLNNEVCHIIPRKFLLLEWKNAGIIGGKEEKDDLLPFERIIHSVIVGPKHEIYHGIYEIEELPFRHKLVSLDEKDPNIDFLKLYRRLFLDLNNIYDGKLLEAGVNVILGRKFLLIVPLTQPIYRQNDLPVFPVPMSYIGYILRPQLTDIWPQTAKIDQKVFHISPHEIVTRSTATLVDYVPEPSRDLGYEEDEPSQEQAQEQLQEQPVEEQPQNPEEQPLNTEEQALADQAGDQVQLDGQGQQEGVQLIEQPQSQGENAHHQGENVHHPQEAHA